MNLDSRKKGKGKRAEKYRAPTQKRRVPAKVKAKLIDPKSAEALAIVRAQALTGLADLVGKAVATLEDCLTEGPTRAQGSRSSDARYVLDVVFDRIKEAEAALGEDEATQTPVDELAKRRAELQKHVRAQRRDMEKEDRNYK